MREYTLRPYQEEAVTLAIEFLKSGQTLKGKKRKRAKNGLLILPTGSGKSLVAANIIRNLDGPCTLFNPNGEILDQNFEKLVSYGFEPAIYSASRRSRKVGAITLATIGTAKTAPELFQDMKYVIVDEAHLVNAKTGMYQRFLKAVGDAQVLGLTASPYRLSANSYGSILRFLTRTRPKVFDEVVYVVQNRDLFDQGYLAKLTYHRVTGFQAARLLVNTTGTEYTDESVKAHFKEIGFDNGLVIVVKRLLEIGRKGILVFTRFVEESAYLAEQIPGVVLVHADTPKDQRERIIRAFKAGEIKAVCNVGVLSIGFDYPQLDTVVLARPSMSLALYYQQVGRGVRTHPDKESTMIVDMVGLAERFGKVEDLVIKSEGKRGKSWFVASGDHPLTNVYFGEPRPKPTRRVRRRPTAPPPLDSMYS